MLLLDHLLTIETQETEKDKQTYATGLYVGNKTFAMYADLAYKKEFASRYDGLKIFPIFKLDKIGYGLHFSSLEKIHNKFKISAFKSHLNDIKAEKVLIQVFESVSDIEIQFLKYVARREIPWFDRELWKTSKHI